MEAPAGYALYLVQFKNYPMEKCLGWFERDLRVWHVETAAFAHLVVNFDAVEILQELKPAAETQFKSA